MNDTDLSQRAILVVEDDPKIAQILLDYLQAEGYRPITVADGYSALRSVESNVPAAIILDVMLPGLDGIEVCRAVRSRSDVPIMMLTARVDEIDRLLGLDIGADDYVCKPFSPREVMARLRALIRRAEGRAGPRESVPAPVFAIDAAGQRIRWRGAALALTPIEYRILHSLVSQPGRVFARAQLLDASREEFRDVSDRAIDSHIKNIRRKIASLDPAADAIASIYGAGYRFDPPAS